MDITQLDGLYSKEMEESGQDSYYIFQLAGYSLRQLAALLRRLAVDSCSCLVRVGRGNIRFETISDRLFSVELSGDEEIVLKSNPDDLNNLAARLEEMAQAESDPDYLVHVHLDTYFSKPPIGLSDVVFQRLDEFHTG